MGSAGVGGLVAQIVFWVLIVVGWNELGVRRVALFVGFWLAGMVGRSYLPYGADFFGPFLALLDIVLVFLVFKGDVKLH